MIIKIKWITSLSHANSKYDSDPVTIVKTVKIIITISIMSLEQGMQNASASNQNDQDLPLGIVSKFSVAKDTCT